MNVSKRSLAAILLLLLGAYALRLYRLDGQSLWWDEGISLHLATSSAADIVRDRLNNIHPPLYFFLLKGWLALVGVSPFTGRYLSVLAGLLPVALVFAAAGCWGRQTRFEVERFSAAAWLAAGLMVLSPLSVVYSQEIRVYALLPVVYLALLLLAGRWLDRPQRSSETSEVLAIAIIAWFALHLHYIARPMSCWPSGRLRLRPSSPKRASHPSPRWTLTSWRVWASALVAHSPAMPYMLRRALRSRAKRARSTAANRRWPPGVTIAGRSPLLAQRRSVVG